MKKYSIGQVSKSLKISVQAIRLYQKKGLIKPTEVDENSGYRYFDEKEMGKLWRIKVLQSAGFELKEIKKLDELTLSSIEAILKIKRDKLQEEIKIKSMALDYLDRQLKAIDIWEKDSNIDIRWIDRRYGFSFGTSKETSLYNHLIELNNVEGTFGVNQEVTYMPSRRLNYVNGKMKFLDLFAIYQDKKTEINYQESGWYICYHKKEGSNIEEIYDNLINYIKENGYTLRGDAIEILLINDNLINDSKYNLREIQIAIIKD
ncbi:MerR family transcriptional regulator [Clostridiaceae bacterium HSG29]|nr:MerR family transcriptional regulator [Clostridiaceae bacterium HSG29]